MSELNQTANDRRTTRDRRHASSGGRRNIKRDERNRVLRALARDAALVVVLVATIIFAVNHVRPIFAGSETIAQSLAERAPEVRAPIAPEAAGDTGVVAEALNSDRGQADRRAFAEDLVRTGRMSQERADSIAYYAVREAYLHGIPPAVIFGVMLTENARFVSHALSNVGAVGLMQVYPKIWLKELGDRFGTDLAADSTNLKYGVYILREYIKPQKGEKDLTAGDVNRGLLRYNGCVRGTNTPNCKTYPSKVKRYVEKQAESLCGDKTFYDCIAKPFMVGLLGKSD
jgi:soluble lytic murein transglycosylase-like protein